MKKTTTETKPKATAAGVPVYCAHDAIIRAAEWLITERREYDIFQTSGDGEFYKIIYNND